VRDVVSAGASARLDCAFNGGDSIEVRVTHAIAAKIKPGDAIALAPREARGW
jgi:ASC-1-like (ASCH) protein